jgi:hypothetical protein
LPLDDGSATVVPVSGTLPPFPFPRLSTELVVLPLLGPDELASTDCSTIVDWVVATVSATSVEGTTVVSSFDDDVEAGSVASVVSAFELTHSERDVGAPSEGNSVSRTVNAAAVPPTAVQQYNNHPTNALVRRRVARRGIEASLPRSTLRIDARSVTPRAEPLIIG